MGWAELINALRGIAGLVLLLAVLCTPVRAEEVFASLGTGEVNGVYYPVGGDICRLVNRDLARTGVRCSAESTPGSVYNVNAVRSGELEFGIIQSDVAFAAYHGTGPWTGQPFIGLRSVLALHPELVTIIARRGAGVREVADLAGKRVNVGSSGSGSRKTWDAIEGELGWGEAQRGRPTGLSADATTRALCSGEIDANLLIVGHPSPLVRTQLSACAANLVAISGAPVDKLLRVMPYYRRGDIPGDLYGLPADIPSFGVAAVLMTSAGMDARVVAVVAKAVIVHLGELQKMHPALARLSVDAMIAGGLPAPLHPGAVQAYKELGLLK